MDNFPLDEDLGFPISPVSSALDSLCHLQPHSSFITIPSQLDFTWSSGDIPIVLYDDGYVHDPYYNGHINRASFVSLDKDVGYSGSSNRLSATPRSRDQVGTPRRALRTSGSSDTICSGDTFGAKRQTSITTDNLTSHFGIQTSGTPDFVSQDSEDEVIHGDHSQEGCSDNSEFQASERQGLDPAGHYFGPATPGASTVASGSTFEVSTLDASSLLQNVSDYDLGDTPTKESPRTLSWISTREWSYEQYKDFVAQEGPPYLPTRTETFKEEDRTERPYTPPMDRKALGRHRTNVENLPYSSSVSDLREDFHTRDERRSSLRSPCPTADVSWLKDTTIQLLVDQEGFRDAEPSFKFSGILRVRSSSDANDVMVQFRPSSRQAFHFHYAPLESSPVLRRVTVNNDEASDYISRQAYLILKSNGVYVVRGQEAVSTERNSASVKLRWQFEYLVDDRRVDISGSKRNLEGEKIFTPLTFSCSPKLLSPTQAKRINIMQVFKKIVAPKLVAEKLQPPLSSRNINNSPTGVNGTSESVVGSNRRSHQQRDDNGPKQKPIFPAHQSDMRNVYDHDHNHLPASPDGYFSRSRASTPSPPKSRHIVPPARLSDLVSFASSKENSPMPVTPERKRPNSSETMISDHIGEVFTALAPRPKSPPRK